MVSIWNELYLVKRIEEYWFRQENPIHGDVEYEKSIVVCFSYENRFGMHQFQLLELVKIFIGIGGSVKSPISNDVCRNTISYCEIHFYGAVCIVLKYLTSIFSTRLSWDNEYREKSDFSVFFWIIIEDSFVYLLGGLNSRSISTLMIDSFFELCEFRRGKRVFGVREIAYSWIENECLMRKSDIG